MMSRLRFLTAGESHGRALAVIIEGMPAGLALDEEQIARDLARRQGGHGRSARMKIEHDRAEIISGVRHGLSIGSPICLVIWNRDWENWKTAMSVSAMPDDTGKIARPRPGHADLAGLIKYGLDDIRPILERASARETAARVAAGAVARRFLEVFGIAVRSHTLAIGEIAACPPEKVDWQKVEESPVRCSDREAEKAMMDAIDAAASSGDSLGGATEVLALRVPVGLGSHVHWDRRLDGRLAQAIMSINSVKGVEIGDAFELARARGSQAHDVIMLNDSDVSGYRWKRSSNRAGGIEGGITNGEPIVLRALVKPVPTMRKPLPSVDLSSGREVEAHFERSDICVVPAVGVIAEAMLAMVLADAMLEKFGGDNLEETRRNYASYLEAMRHRI